MKTQERIANNILRLVEFSFRFLIELIQLVFIILRWCIKKVSSTFDSKWKSFNSKLIDFIYKRAVQTFNYKNEV